MSDYQGNIIIKNPATPTGPSAFGRAPGMWKLSDVAYWIKQGVWPNPAIVPDTFFPYVSLLLSTTSLGNANNNLFVDSSGVLNPVSRGGNTTQGSFTPYATNWSNYFDGSGDYLTISTNAAFGYGTGDFTIEFWLNLSGVPAAMSVVSNLSSASGTSPHLYIATDGTLRYYTASVDRITSSVVPLQQWIHVALCRSSGSTRMFFNGVQTGSTYSDSNNYGSSNPVGIATYWNGTPVTTNTLFGYLSNIRILKGVGLYTTTFTPPTSPLTAISGTSLLTCQSNRFRDASSNNFTITPAGNTSVTDFGPFSPSTYAPIAYNQSDITNWSGYFDGSSWLNVADNAALDFGTGDFTVECWVNFPVSPSGDQVFVAGWTAGEPVSGWTLTMGTGGFSFVSAVSASYVVATNTAARTAGVWHHVAAVRSSGSVTVYVNGVGNTPTSNTQSINTQSSGLDIARSTYTANRAYYTGYISNLRIVKGAAVYTGNFTPPTTNLTAISGTSLLTLQNAAFTDNSTNNFGITPNANVTVTGNSPFNTTGYWSNYFDGTDDYLGFPNNAALQMGTSDFTVEGWVFLNSYNASYGSIISTSANAIGTNGFGLIVSPAGAFRFFSFVSTTYVATGATIPLNQWTHVAATRSSGTLRLFVNGVLSATAANTDNFNGDTSGGGIGGWVSFNAGGLAGYISNLRMVKGTAVYTADFTVPTAPLTAISGTSLLTCQNGRYIDNSTNAFTITPYGNTSVQSFDPFYTSTVASNGGSMYFSSTNTGALETILRVPASNTLDIGAGDFTVECWVYLTSTQNFSRIIQFNNTWSSAGAAALIYAETDQQKFAVAAFDFGVALIVADNTYVLNTWYHIAVTRVGNVFSMYVNGVKQSGTYTTSSRLWATTTPFMSIGNGPTSAGGFSPMQGYVSDVRIIRGTAIYTASFTPPTAPLTPTPATVLLVNGMNAAIYDATTINDMTTFGNAQVRFPTPFAPANYWAGYFDSGYLDIAANSAFNLSGDFTWEFWVNTTRTVDSWVTGYYVSNPGFTTQVAYLIAISGGNYIVSLNSGSTETVITIGTAASISNGAWNHIACTRSGNTVRTFVNGTLTSTTTYSSTLNNPAGAVYRIGGITGTFEDPFAGSISNARIVKGTAVYTSNFTPSTTPLTAISGTSLLTCQNKTFIDNSSNAFTITANGNATAGAIGPFTATGGTSVYFDGSGDYLSTPSNPAYALSGTSFTIEAWVYVTSSSEPYQAVVKAVGSGSNNLMFIDYSGGSTGVLSSQSGGTVATRSGVTLNTWHHLAVVRNGTSVTCYVNGVGGTPQTIDPGSSGSVSLLVGYDGGTSPARYFNGYMDDLRVTRGVARYTSNFTPPTQAFPVY